jgi:GNAT superfamily N-acetyltransferase
MGAGGGPGVEIRPMEDADLDAVVELLGRALGPAPGGVDRRALFEWKHLANPFGRSVALVAESGSGLVGVRTLMRWQLVAPGGVVVPAVRAVDTATAPEARRRGVFSALTTAALERCSAEGVEVVFNTPNAASRPGYLRMGWRDLGRWPVRLKVRRAARLAAAAARRELRSGPPVAVPQRDPLGLAPAGEVLARAELGELVAASSPATGLRTGRSPGFLRWRYSDGPVPYHAVAFGDPPEALLVVRVRRRGRLTEAVVCEALCGRGAGSIARLAEALRALPAAAGADHAVAGHARTWGDASAALSRAGYRRLPGVGIRLVVRPVAAAKAWAPSAPDPLRQASWALTLGDLELF